MMAPPKLAPNCLRPKSNGGCVGVTVEMRADVWLLRPIVKSLTVPRVGTGLGDYV